VSEPFHTLETELGSLERAIQKVKARHVNTRKVKDAIRMFVQRYFTEWRNTLAAILGSNGHLSPLDAEMQELLRCTQRRALVEEYRKRLRATRRAVDALELLVVGAPPQGIGFKQLEARQQRILETVGKLCASAATSYEQGLEDLAGCDRKSWRGTAVEFREALREVLDSLAPDEEVTKQPGFKPEPDTKAPTMKQKAVFILRSRRPKDSQIKAFAGAIDVIEETIGRFVRSVYSRSSTAVHVPVSRDEAIRVKDYVSLVLADLLEIKD
jgi:hypothetical protein